MIDQPQRILHRLGAVAVIHARSLDQHDGQAENACGDDFSLGGLAAGILADDDVDSVLTQQRHFRLDGEGAARQEVLDIGRLQRRIDGIDAAHQIVVLRRGVEGLCLLPADGEEDAARLNAQRSNGVGNRGDARPAVAPRFLPAEPFQPQQRDAGRLARRAGVGRNLLCKGMRRVDQEIDGLFAKMGNKPRHAAEAAGAHRHGLRRGIERASGKRQRDGKVAPFCKASGKRAGLARAAQYEDASLVHA